MRKVRRRWHHRQLAQRRSGNGDRLGRRNARQAGACTHFLAAARRAMAARCEYGDYTIAYCYGLALGATLARRRRATIVRGGDERRGYQYDEQQATDHERAQ